VVVANQQRQRSGNGQAHQQVGTDCRVLLDVLVFLTGQRAGFVQQPVGDRELADVVKQRGGFNREEEFGVDDSDLRRQRHGVAANPLGVFEGRQVSRGHGSGQREKGR